MVVIRGTQLLIVVLPLITEVTQLFILSQAMEVELEELGLLREREHQEDAEVVQDLTLQVRVASLEVERKAPEVLPIMVMMVAGETIIRVVVAVVAAVAQ